MKIVLQLRARKLPLFCCHLVQQSVYVCLPFAFPGEGAVPLLLSAVNCLSDTHNHMLLVLLRRA